MGNKSSKDMNTSSILSPVIPIPKQQSAEISVSDSTPDPKSLYLNAINPDHHLIFGVSTNNLNIMLEFDKKSEKFVPTNKSTSSFLNYSGAVLKNSSTVIICGGISHDLKKIQTKCLEMNLETKEIRYLPSLLEIRYTFPICYFEDHIYAIGGRVYGNDNQTAILGKCERYSYQTKTWTKIADLNKARCTSSLAIVNNQVWTFGGFTNKGKRTRKVEKYNPVLDKWEFVSFKLAFGVDAFNMLPSQNKEEIFFFGGKLQDGTCNKILKYNLRKNTYMSLGISSFNNLISKFFPLSDHLFLIVGETNDQAVGNIFDTILEKIVHVYNFGKIDDLVDLKKLNFTRSTPVLEFEESSICQKFIFEPNYKIPNQTESEISQFNNLYNTKNLYFGNDCRSYFVEINSKTGEVFTNNIPTSLQLFCSQSVTRIAPNVVFFCGGINKLFTKIQDACFIFDIASNKVERLPSLRFPKYSFPCVFYKGCVYAIGGRVYGVTGSAVLKSVDRFNLTTKTWESIPGLQIARCTSNAHVIKNRIYVIGGYTTELTRTSSVEIYEDTFNEWRAFGVHLSEPIEAGFSYALTDRIFYCGGRNHKMASVKKEVFRIDLGDFGISEVLPDKINQGSILQRGLVFRDFIVIFGGANNFVHGQVDIFMKSDFSNVNFTNLFVEDRNRLIVIGKKLALVFGGFIEGKDVLRQDSFVLASEEFKAAF